MSLWTPREHELLLQVSPVIMVTRATRHTLSIIHRHRGGLGDQKKHGVLVIHSVLVIQVSHKGHLRGLLDLDNLA